MMLEMLPDERKLTRSYEVAIGAITREIREMEEKQ